MESRKHMITLTDGGERCTFIVTEKGAFTATINEETEYIGYMAGRRTETLSTHQEFIDLLEVFKHTVKMSHSVINEENRSQILHRIRQIINKELLAFIKEINFKNPHRSCEWYYATFDQDAEVVYFWAEEPYKRGGIWCGDGLLAMVRADCMPTLPQRNGNALLMLGKNFGCLHSQTVIEYEAGSQSNE